MNTTLPDQQVELRVADADLLAVASPRRGAPWRGRIAKGMTFEVFGHVEGQGCADWGRVANGAYTCLDGTTPASTPAPPAALHGDLPFLYAHRASGLPGPIYASLDAWLAGDPPRAWMTKDHSYHFVELVQTANGDALVRADGRVVPAARTRAYEPSPFAGRDLVLEPVPDGAALGWCVEREGCGAADGTRLAFHDAFTTDTFAPATGHVRTWRPASPPVGLAPDETWIDVDVNEQTLAIMQGAEARFVTLVSTGVGGLHETPKGAHRIPDKLVHNDMASLPGAAEYYYVEGVPWVVHFRPRYALHGAYWHDKFGWRASHGCVNLSPADARRVFEAVSPPMPLGWRAVYAGTETSTLLRVR